MWYSDYDGRQFAIPARDGFLFKWSKKNEINNHSYGK